MPSIEDVPPEPKIQPDIKAIVDLLRPGGEIEEAGKRAGDALAATGKIFQRIEKNLHGNRKAVTMIRGLQKMPADKRNDCIRTLEPLLVHYGFTLDAIDPEELPLQPRPNADGDEDEDGQAGHNASTSALDDARAKLNGGGDAEPGAEPVQGSVQLRKYLALRRGGESMKDAAETAGIDLGEAKLHDEAEAKGEYKHIKGPAKGKPKLGIVARGSDTAQ